MSNSISALHTSTSPHFEDDGQRRLTGRVVPRADLTGEERDQMFVLLETYFERVDRARFETDLAEKEAVILLRDSSSDRVHGFSTFMRIDDEEIVAFFSGDTIVDRQYWGETVLSRIWGQTVFAEADRIVAQRPETRVYWFLICSGYKTWRFLPVFFRQFYPNAETTTPPELQRILDTLGARKFGDQYGSGIVRFRAATPLRRGIADVTEERMRDPRIAFFARMNPGHAEGDELACLTEISRTNLTRAGHRML